MAIPQLKEAIFGIHIRNGALFLGWLGLIVAALGMVMGAAELNDVMSNFDDNYRSNYQYKEFDKEDTKRMIRIKTEEVIGAVFGIVVPWFFFTLSALLLIGIFKRRPGFMVPWLVICGVLLAFTSFLAFKEAFCYSGISRDVFQMIVVIAVNYYCFLIVFSHHKELQEQNNANNILGHQILTNEAILATDAPVKTSNNFA